MNEVYIDCFGDHRPARSAIGVAELPLGALVEVEAWARLGGRMTGMLGALILAVRDRWWSSPVSILHDRRRRRRASSAGPSPKTPRPDHEGSELVDARRSAGSAPGSDAPAGLAEAVADRAHGLDEVGVLLAELGPEAPDVDVDRAGAAVVLVAPHPVTAASRG